MQVLFRRLSGDVQVTQWPLEVKGREFCIERAAGSVAWLDYQELIDQEEASEDIAEAPSEDHTDQTPKLPDTENSSEDHVNTPVDLPESKTSESPPRSQRGT